MERTDRAVYEMVMRNGLRARTAGTDHAHGMREPGTADDSVRRQVAAGSRGGTAREEIGGVLMLISNGARVVECAPWLMIIDGGRE